MATCVNCGDEASRPVWAVYADPAFERRGHGSQVPFALHSRCFTANERVTVTEWRPVDPPVERKDAAGRVVRDGHGQPILDSTELVEFEITRYRKVDSADG